MIATAVAVLALAVPWHPGSQQAPLSHAGMHHGGPEVCVRWSDWPRGLWVCELIDRPRRAIRRHYRLTRAL